MFELVGHCGPWHLVLWDGFALAEASWELDDGSPLSKGLIYVGAMEYYSSKEDAVKITKALRALKIGKSAETRIELKKFSGEPFVLDLVNDIPCEGKLTFYVK